MTQIYMNFSGAHLKLKQKFKTAPEVHAQKWQGTDVSERPEAKMIELLHESFKIQLPTASLDHYRNDIPANYPWADDHFEERICGFPLNPGKQWRKWPWGNSAEGHLDLDGNRFNHNYMERYWPKYAGIYNRPTVTAQDFMFPQDKGRGAIEQVPQWVLDEVEPAEGIRSEYGDLNDLINTLANEPDTRQAYFPIFFPEDVTVKGRKPCTLGYHFILRHGYFHCTYYMRSCDFYRHWADDCYLTIRLMMHILRKCKQKNPRIWKNVEPGFYIMHITSLHMFVNDVVPLGIDRR